MFDLSSAALLVLFAIVLLISGVKILSEYERAVIFRLGRLVPHRGPGIIYVIPLLERMVRVDLRTITMDIPAQDVITRDNVSVKVSAVLYFRVLDPSKATVEIENYLFATSQLAQTTLRSVCGRAELDELLAEREKINTYIQEIIDAQTEPWGIKVSLVEVKHIDLPQEMQRAIARQAEAERERRAKVISAEGEFQAAQRLAEASQIIEQHPVALQLRYLQTLSNIATGNPSTTLFPVPINLVTPFLGGNKQASDEPRSPA
ncbi:MAG: slipin family protein [Candidatus Binatia bacterium]|nr:slipin family protein [Candidatus Binatia bacterium]